MSAYPTSAQTNANSHSEQHDHIDRNDFVDEIDGMRTDLFKLENDSGMEVLVTNYGARIVAVRVPDKDGNFEDVVLGFDDLAGYRSEMDQAFGATVGRYANRIANGRFELDGKYYTLDQNDGQNTLHSGSASWMHVVWEVSSFSEGHLTLVHRSADGEGGFPGEVYANVTFSLSDNNVLRIVFNAESNERTVVNMTNHSYFNLAGECSGNVAQHRVRIHSRAITEVEEGLIPTGELLPVDGTPLDLRAWKPVGEGLDSNDPNIALAYGFDFNYALDQSAIDPDGLTLAAEVFDPESRRSLEVWTTQPGLQFYTGNWIHEGIIGKSGRPYEKHAGFCLETQHYPDSPNQAAFPSTVVDADHPYHNVCEYRFGIRK